MTNRTLFKHTKTQELYRTRMSYNPFYIEVAGKEYRAIHICLYHPEGEVFFRQLPAWFGSYNKLKSLEIPLAILRRISKFDGQTFIISSGRDYYGAHDRICALYIPIYPGGVV